MFRREPDPFPDEGAENRNPSDVSFFQLVREDFEAHGRSLTPGFRALALHRFGNLRMDIRPRVIRLPFSLLYVLLYRRMIVRHRIELPYAASVGRRVVFEPHHGIVISGFCRIGDECRIRHNVTMGIRRAGETACPTLGRGVDVGMGAVILGGISLGDGAVVSANAVVVRDVPAGMVATGVPARNEPLERDPSATPPSETHRVEPRMTS